MPVKAPRVVVAVSPPESVETVPHAKPDWVASAPPLLVIDPTRLAALYVGLLAKFVVTVGETAAAVVKLG
jgi:hypothetical protein